MREVGLERLGQEEKLDIRLPLMEVSERNFVHWRFKVQKATLNYLINNSAVQLAKIIKQIALGFCNRALEATGYFLNL